MKLVRRITLALASIAALAMAGGAHWRAGWSPTPRSPSATPERKVPH